MENLRQIKGLKGIKEGSNVTDGFLRLKKLGLLGKLFCINDSLECIYIEDFADTINFCYMLLDARKSNKDSFVKVYLCNYTNNIRETGGVLAVITDVFHLGVVMFENATIKNQIPSKLKICYNQIHKEIK